MDSHYSYSLQKAKSAFRSSLDSLNQQQIETLAGFIQETLLLNHFTSFQKACEAKGQEWEFTKFEEQEDPEELDSSDKEELEIVDIEGNEGIEESTATGLDDEEEVVHIKKRIKKEDSPSTFTPLNKPSSAPPPARKTRTIGTQTYLNSNLKVVKRKWLWGEYEGQVEQLRNKHIQTAPGSSNDVQIQATPEEVFSEATLRD